MTIYAEPCIYCGTPIVTDLVGARMRCKDYGACEKRAAMFASVSESDAVRHWHLKTTEAQRDVARLTAERDEALTALSHMTHDRDDLLAERDRLRRELGDALAGREREYARAEAEHDAAARIASEWAAQDPWRAVDPCHRCWGPTLAGSLVCGKCADDETRQMPGGAM